jgi:hypothetical protein
LPEINSMTTEAMIKYKYHKNNQNNIQQIKQVITQWQEHISWYDYTIQ